MGILVFGDKDFVDRFYNSNRLPIPISGTAEDASAAAQVLQDASDADDVVIGFQGQDGIDFTFMMAELYGNRRFYLAPDVTPTPELWSKAFASKIRIVSREGIPLSVAQVLPIRENDNSIRYKRVTMFSLVGGAGKSNITASIACTAALWASKNKKDIKVVVVGATNNRAQTIFEALRVPATVSQGIDNWQTIKGTPGWGDVESLLVRPDPVLLPNLYFLPPPAAAGSHITAELLQRVLGILDHYFDLILIDVKPDYDVDASLAAVQASSLTLFLVRGNYPDVRIAKYEFAPYIPKLKIDAGSVRLVVTRVYPGEEKEFSPQNVAETIGGGIVPFRIVIPEDRALHANFKAPGKPPIAVADRGCPFSTAVRELTSFIMGVRIER
jgi:pilus assembly protein CpaE